MKRKRALVRLLEAKGCAVEFGGKHIKIVTPSGEVCHAPVSTSDWRSVKNLASQLRHGGVDIHWKELT